MKTRNQAGYTIVELIVTVSIIILMTAIVVGTYMFGGKADQLSSKTKDVASVLRTTRSRAFNGVGFSPGWVCDDGSGNAGTEGCREDADCAPNSCEFYKVCSVGPSKFCDSNANCAANEGHCVDSFYPTGATTHHGGYGVYFDADDDDKGTYTVFADAYDETPAGTNYYEGSDEMITTYQLSDGFVFVFPNAAASDAEVMFDDKDIDIYQNSGGWSEYTTQSDFQILIRHKDGCPATDHKQGRVTIDRINGRINEEIIDC